MKVNGDKHMSEPIYLISDDEQLIPMRGQAYKREADLQQLLQDFPDLLAGEQVDASSPRRWLFVAREVSVPAEHEGAGRWFLDHLFLDQDAIPTFVEVKRKSDTRLRREVVGQMLDYAANAVVYWPGNSLREQFQQTCEDEGLDPDALLAEITDNEDAERFWQTAHDNLREGRVRLVFVADRIPPELQRVVEFLNERMSPTEVLALEIRRYVGGGFATHIPRIIGQTSGARITKTGGTSSGSTRRRRWDEPSFFEDAGRHLDESQLAAVRRLYEWSNNHADHIDWGTGTRAGGFMPKFDHVSVKSVYGVRSTGAMALNFKWLQHTDAGRACAHRLGQQLEQSGLFALPTDYLHRHPTLHVDDWAPHVEVLIGVLERAILPAR